jgi:transposase-like protein
MGRPTLYNEERIRIVLQALKLGLSYEAAASLAGVNRNTVLAWRNEHEEFREACERVIGQCQEKHATIVSTAAETDPKWAAWFLERRFPLEWGNLRPEVIAARKAVMEPPEQDASDGVSDEQLKEAARK